MMARFWFLNFQVCSVLILVTLFFFTVDLFFSMFLQQPSFFKHWKSHNFLVKPRRNVAGLVEIRDHSHLESS